MAQTALTKAIEQISQYRDKYNPMCDEFTIIDKCIDELTDLLPYEREQIEAAYRQGDADAMKENMGDLGDRLYRSETDYFTKTYTK
jgi:hypothetical protein